MAVGGPKDLSGAALASFSFGSGAICPNFAGCDQPGLTNSAIAATAIHALPKLAAGGTTHLMMQWETARAAADILGLATSSFEGDKGPDDYPSLAKSCTQWSTGEVCVWKVELHMDRIAMDETTNQWHIVDAVDADTKKKR